MKHRLLKFIFITLTMLIVIILYHIFNKNLNISTIMIEKKASNSFSGNYLSGYYSAKISRPDLTAMFFQSSLEDASNNFEIQETLLEYSYISNIMIGNVKNAISLIHKYHRNNSPNYLITIIKVFEDLSNRQFQKARIKLEEALGNDNIYKIDELLLNILISWCYVGEGDYERALSYLGNLSTGDEIIILQEAMIADLANLNDLAKSKYAQLSQLSLSYDIVNLIANFYIRQNNYKKAESLYQTLLAINPNNPIFQKSIREVRSSLIKNLSNDAKSEEINLQKEDMSKELNTMPSNFRYNNTTPKKIINNAIDGVVFTFTLIANMLNKEVFYIKSLICSELALYLKPNYEAGHMLVASTFMELNDYKNAIEHYKKIGVNSEFYHYAQLETAKILYKMNDLKNARYMFRSLYHANPSYLEPLILLANGYNIEGQYSKANDIYTSIISKLSKPRKQDWILFYLRATNYGSMKNNTKAEQDLEVALKLDPEQHIVMNDLAYSWIESGKNILQASKMIKIAYDKDPQNPQIMDSMGWALYLQGNYKEAIDFLEKSIEVIPTDAAVSEHLGDAYFKLAYKIQAKYEWERALHNSEDEYIKKRLRKKLAQL